jgi:glycosyltransferase involved in cell wall biosynthesis
MTLLMTYLGTGTFLGLAILALALGVLWLFENRRFARRKVVESCPHLTELPKVTVVIPCLDGAIGFRENLVSFLRQDYSNFEIIFVVRSRQDRCAKVIKSLIEENRFLKLRMVVSSQIPTTGHQSEMLLAGIRAASHESAIFAFGNARVRVNGSWLRWFVFALQDHRVGVVTGSVWHLPRHQSFANRMFAIVHNSVSAFFGPGRQATLARETWAIRAATLERCELKSIWERSVDDCWTTVAAVKTVGLQITYEPQCRGVATVDLSVLDFLRATHRENVFEFAYAKSVWILALGLLALIQSAYWFTFVACLTSAFTLKADVFIWGGLNAAIYGLGIYRISLKNQIGKLSTSEWRQMRATRNLDLLAWPLIELFVLVWKVGSAFHRSIVWNGFYYQSAVRAWGG